MDIVVQLRPEAAQSFRAHDSEDPAVQRIDAVLAESGAMMSPQFPDIADPLLQSYYVVFGLPDDQGERVAAALRELDEVEAAYEQPRPSPA